MTIRLPVDLASSVEAAVQSGRFGSAEELVAEAVQSLLRPHQVTSPGNPLLGSIGFMSDAADELDEIVADAYRKRDEETWRDIDFE